MKTEDVDKVDRIVVYTANSCNSLVGKIQFIDQNGVVLLSAGDLGTNPRIYHVKEGERIVGFQARSDKDRNYAKARDLQFVFGSIKQQ